MRRIKVLVEFLRLPIPDKIAYYRNVLAKMRANATVFPNPDKDLKDAQSLVDSLELKYLAAQDGGPSATLAMHTAEAAADDTFRILAAYVDRIASCDESVILESGFTPSKQPASSQKAILAAYDGDKAGEVSLVARAISGAKAYVWQKAQNAIPSKEGDWCIFAHTTQSYTDDMEQAVGDKMYYRVAGITTDGVTDYTAPVLKIVN